MKLTPPDEVGLPDEVELTDKVGLATKEIRIQADMSGGKGPPSPIEFNIPKTVFKRAKEVLEGKDKKITPIKVGGVVVFAVAATAVGAVVAKKIIEKRQEEKRLKEEAQIPLLTEEQEAEFTAIFESLLKKIYGYIYYRVDNVQDAEDLTCKVFTKALVAFPGFIPDEKLPNPHLSWLYRIAHNALANYYRDKERRERRIETVENTEEVEAQSIPFFSRNTSIEDKSEEPSEKIEILRQVLSSLSDRDKTIIWLKFVEKLSNEDIASILGISKGAVKSLCSRILHERIESRLTKT